MTVAKRPAALRSVENLSAVLDMDVLWLKANQVAHAFEVESTTTMTSGLQRGSNLPATVPKTMVIPEERARDHERKMRSPLFSEHFNKDNWNLLFFDAFRQAFAKQKSKVALESLFGKKNKQALRCARTRQTASNHFSSSTANTSKMMLSPWLKNRLSNPLRGH